MTSTLLRTLAMLTFLKVDVERVVLPSGKMVSASKFGGNMEAGDDSLELTDEEKVICQKAAAIWKGILNVDVDDSTDFFACGAGSMDVVRSVSLCDCH